MGPTNLSQFLVKFLLGNLTCSHQRLCLQGIVSMISSTLFLLTPPEVIMLCSLEMINCESFHMRVEPLGTNQGLASGSGSHYTLGTAAGLLLLGLKFQGYRTSEVQNDHRNPEK